MVEKSSHGMPETGPKTEFARRLEYVRTNVGHGDSLRAFWRELCDGWDEEEAVSYEAVRRYHYKREPPLRYMKRVVEVFPQFRLAWLVGDEGSPTKQEHAEELRRRHSIPDRPLLEAVTDRHPWLCQLTIGVQQTFLDVLRALEIQTEGGRALDGLDVEGVEEERLEIADDLVFALTVPLRLWGVPFPDLLREDATVSMEMPGPFLDLDGYFRQALGGLATILVDRTPGDRLENRPASVVASLRRAWEEGDLPEPTEEEQERAGRVQAALDERVEARRERLEEKGLGVDAEPILTSDSDSSPPSPRTPAEALEGTRRDLEQAREDDLPAKTIERLEDEVERLKSHVDESNRHEED